MRLVLIFAAALATAQQTAPVSDYFLTGSAADVQPRTEPGFVLMGGGKDVDAAFEWLIRKSGGGDFVVVRASGADGYNAYVTKLGTVDSVESLVIKTPAEARDPKTVERIRKAEALFIAGGDQWNYVNIWGPSPVRTAIQGLIDRGVPVGGTSAGLAVLGEFAFNAEKDSVTSEQALRNPYDERVTIGQDFLKIPALHRLTLRQARQDGAAAGLSCAHRA